jgi:guanine nucleotide-binding protein alpha-1 subunit
MYRPSSIDQERISWKTVIYFNVVRSIKHILATLEAWDDTLDDEVEHAIMMDDTASIIQTKTRINGISDQPSPSTSLLNSASIPSIAGSPGRAPSPTSSPVIASKEASSSQIAYLRRKLMSIVSSDGQLADRLSGGITVSGSGKGAVYVRSGWQARTIENALGRLKPRSSPHDDAAKKASISQDAVPDILVEEVGRMLTVSKDDIKELWNHPIVRGMIVRRKLKLDEWSELWVSCKPSFHS